MSDCYSYILEYKSTEKNGAWKISKRRFTECLGHAYVDPWQKMTSTKIIPSAAPKRQVKLHKQITARISRP